MTDTNNPDTADKPNPLQPAPPLPTASTPTADDIAKLIGGEPLVAPVESPPIVEDDTPRPLTADAIDHLNSELAQAFQSPELKDMTAGRLFGDKDDPATPVVDPDAPAPVGETEPPTPAPDTPVEPGPEAEIEDGRDVTDPDASVGYTYHYIDPATNAPASTIIPDSSIEQALGLAQWANNLPDPVKAAFGAIESGQAVAIPRADYEQFVAWANQKNQTATAPGAPASPPANQPQFNLDDLDPDTAQAVQALQSQIATLQSQLSTTTSTPQPDPSLTNYVNERLVATSRAYDTAIETYAQARNLTAEEKEHLVNAAIQSNLVPVFQQKHTKINPATGTVMQEADPASVVYDALDYALWQDQNLYQSVATRTAPPAAPTATSPTPPQPSRTQPVTEFSPEQQQAITAKKAQASSLATAPSAAVSRPARDVKSMSQEEIRAAMAAELSAVMNGTG